MKTKLLIFGITGDLGTHRLLPALNRIIGTGNFKDLTIIGVSRRSVEISELLADLSDHEALANKLLMYSMDLEQVEEYHKLREFVALNDDEQLIIDLAVPPSAVQQIIDNLGNAGFNSENVKILFEKPFGVDLESAKNVINQSALFYKEDQIYRIDHYLAKEMAQNIVAFRGKNALFSGVWNNNFIESIQIIASEKIGIEGREHLYEQTGALRDVVQGHLMQLLALMLMGIPHDFDWDNLPDLRLDALSHIKPANPEKAVRAQYEGYKNEVNNQDSNVETFVSLELESDQPSWKGVSIKLVTGKKLVNKTTEIRVKFKQIYSADGNCLIFHIQPNEGIEISLFVKKPGYENEFETRSLRFSYPENTVLPDAYEQVVVDAISSSKSLFACSEEVLQSWRILQPIQDYWKDLAITPKIYTPGANIDEILA